MLDPRLLSELRRIVGPEHVASDPVSAETYSYDASLVCGTPAAVAFPADTAQVAAVVKAAAKAGVPCTPRGFGTNLSGGSIPLHGGVVVGLSRLNRIVAIRPERRCATVQCGVTNLDLQNALAPLGFFYAPDPASQKAATLGGNVAENSGGPHCLKYGVTTNHVLGLEAVLADGQIVHLGEQWPLATDHGYDLRGLFVGSEGTFGIVTEITVRILPRPEAVITQLAIYDRVLDAARSVSAIIAAGIVPATLEMMDALVIQAVEDSYPCGYPRDAAAVLIIEVEGPVAGLKEQAANIEQMCLASGARSIRQAKNAAERDQLWAGRRGAFGAVARIAPNYLVADCSVPRTRLPEALEQVLAIAGRHGFQIGNVFHAGDGNLHPLMLFDARNREHLHRVHEAGREIMQACADLGGTITGEHGIGVEKIEAIRMVFSETDLDFQRTLRHAIDPQGRLNPGKVLPAQLPVTSGQWPVNSNANHRPPTTDHFPVPLTTENWPLAWTPHDPAEAAAMVQAAISSGATLLPVGGGRRVDINPENNLGRKPIPLRTDRLSTLVEHDPPNQVVIAGAGMGWAALQNILAADRQWLPLRPPLADGCTLGGMVALGGCGPERLRYGAPRDRLLGLRFVSGAGRLIAAGGKVVKNVAGYDVTRLLAGSAGTLGLITELTFSVLAMPEVCRAAIAWGSLALCAAAAADLLRSNIEPVFITAEPHPGDRPNTWELAVGFEGFEITVQAQVQRCLALLRQGGLADERELDYPVHDGLHAAKFAALYNWPVLLRADLPPDAVVDLLDHAGGILAGGELLVDFGCGRVHVGLPRLAEEDWKAAGAAAAGAVGQAIVERAPADFKQGNKGTGPDRPEVALMNRIKKELDPHSVFLALAGG